MNLDRDVPTLRVTSVGQEDVDNSLTELEFLLASPTVYGFSLADKLWRTYSVSSPVERHTHNACSSGIQRGTHCPDCLE